VHKAVLEREQKLGKVHKTNQTTKASVYNVFVEKFACLRRIFLRYFCRAVLPFSFFL